MNDLLNLAVTSGWERQYLMNLSLFAQVLSELNILKKSGADGCSGDCSTLFGLCPGGERVVVVEQCGGRGWWS